MEGICVIILPLKYQATIYIKYIHKRFTIKHPVCFKDELIICPD